MPDVSPHDSPEVIHYNLPDDRVKSRGASLGLSLLAITLAIGAGGLAFKLRQQGDTVDRLRAELGQAKAETTSAHADLAKSGATITELHALVDKTQKQEAEAQAQAKKIEQAGAATQAQLQQARADLQSQQQKAQAQVADLQAQLSRANDGSAGLRTELATAKKQIDDLKGQIAKAQDEIAKPQPVAAQARELPLTSEFKKPFFGGGFTLTLKNSSPNPLKLDIEITGSPKTPSKSATIEGGGTLTLGDLAPGAKIAIASDGFTPLNLTAK